MNGHNILRPPNQIFAVDVPAVPSVPPASFQQLRASTGSSEASSLATGDGRNNHRHNSDAPPLDLGRVAFETEHQTDCSFQSASRTEPKSLALSITFQLPGLRPLEEVSRIDLRAIPMFDKEYKVYRLAGTLRSCWYENAELCCPMLTFLGGLPVRGQ